MAPDSGHKTLKSKQGRPGKTHKHQSFKAPHGNFKRNKVVVKKSRSSAPLELSNNAPFNPYSSNNFFNKAGRTKKMAARDPRFSDFSGKLNMEMFKKSYSFLEDMRNEEAREIAAAIKINNKFGTDSAKGVSAMKKIAHLNISSFEEAKRSLDRYKSEKVHLERDEELRKLKKSLVKEEKEKIATTGKKPYYFPDKKVKRIYKDLQRKKIEESATSTAINYGPGKSIHKKLESQSRRKLPKERKLNSIPERRDV